MIILVDVCGTWLGLYLCFLFQNESQELDDVGFDVGVQANCGQDVLEKHIIVELLGAFIKVLLVLKELVLNLLDQRN